MGITITPNDELRHNFQHQLRIGPELEEFVATTLVGRQESSTIDRRKSATFMALADKSFTTFHSIVILLRARLFEDASALVRILYESTMTATFLLAADAREVDDYADFFMYRNWRDHLLAEEVNPNARNAFAPETLKRMQEQFCEVERRYSKGKWTTRSAEDMARAADEYLPTGHKVFSVLYASIYRQCSAYVHSDVRSIQGRIRETPEGLVTINRQIPVETCAGLMYAANFLMLSTCFLVARTFYDDNCVLKWNKLVLRWNGSPDSES
jgi:hypothetical protein